MEDRVMCYEEQDKDFFLGTIFRDLSCIILKILEKKKLGTMIRSNCNGELEQRAALACVDSADFCASGEEYEKMQEIISFCTKMHEAAGGKVQKEKVSMCPWKQKTQMRK